MSHRATVRLLGELTPLTIEPGPTHDEPGERWWIVRFRIRGQPWQLNTDDPENLPGFLRQHPVASELAPMALDEIATVVAAELTSAGLRRER